MKILKLILLGLIFCSTSNLGFAQDNIAIVNGSFEKSIKSRFNSINDYIKFPTNWTDCSQVFFDEVEPPLKLQTNVEKWWGIEHDAYDGKQYIILKSRANGTWNSLSQRLDTPIQTDQLYKINLALAKSPILLDKKDIEPSNYQGHVVFRIWGANAICDENAVLLAESTVVKHEQWLDYEFVFKSPVDCNFIIFDLYCKNREDEACDGHLLVDAISDITKVGNEDNGDPVILNGQLLGFLSENSQPSEIIAISRIFLPAKVFSGVNSSELKHNRNITLISNFLDDLEDFGLVKIMKQKGNVYKGEVFKGLDRLGATDFLNLLKEAQSTLIKGGDEDMLLSIEQKMIALGPEKKVSSVLELYVQENKLGIIQEIKNNL